VRRPDLKQEATMSDDGLKERLAKQGEETLGRLAQDLLENPLVAGALSKAFDARERAAQAQEVAMGALNIPSAADVERLTRRLRSVAQRLEGIEDALDRLERRLEATTSKVAGPDDRMAGVEGQMAALVVEVRALTGALDAAPAPVHRAQERLQVDETKPARKPAARKTSAASRKPAAAKKPA
jgi:chromosome segregation ATPase